MTPARRDLPIIVGGCPRSGTSLLRRILNAHSRIHCGPEVKFFQDFYGAVLADPLHHARFSTTARSILPEDEVLAILGAAFVTLHERAAQRAGKARWADKTPENALYLDQWQRLLDDRWLLIHVVRNPLDTLASIKEIGFPLVIPATIEDRIALYLRYLESGLTFARAHPTRYRRVTYERLVTTPEETLEALMDWLGEAFEPGQLTFNSAPQEIGLEDPKVGQTTAIHDASVGRWQAILTPDEVTLIQCTTADVWSRIERSG